MTSHIESLEAGTHFDRYEIVRLVGSGSMGTVYQATHIDLKKTVALKVLKPALASNPEARARFLHEGESASRIKHPNVVDVTDIGIYEGTPFMVMEYLEGDDLGQVLRREKWLPLSRLVDILLPICAAVQAMHEAGVVHRDIKPSNILLARSRLRATQPKLLDFGISHVADDATRASASASLLGTPYYMSPEQALDASSVDARTDQYALGVILYECSTGVRPFDSHSLPTLLRDIAEKAVTPPKQHLAALPDEFNEVVLQAMARAPGDRFASVHALGSALLPFASAAGQALWNDVFGDTHESAAIAGVNGVAAEAMANAYKPAVPASALTSALRTHPGGTATPSPLAGAHPTAAGTVVGLTTLPGVHTDPPAPSADPPVRAAAPKAPPTPATPAKAAEPPAARPSPRGAAHTPGPQPTTVRDERSPVVDDDDPPVVPVHSARPVMYVLAAAAALVAMIAGGISRMGHGDLHPVAPRPIAHESPVQPAPPIVQAVAPPVVQPASPAPVAAVVPPTVPAAPPLPVAPEAPALVGPPDAPHPVAAPHPVTVSHTSVGEPAAPRPRRVHTVGTHGGNGPNGALILE